jgi:hypothetical protein
MDNNMLSSPSVVHHLVVDHDHDAAKRCHLAPVQRSRTVEILVVE